MSKEELSDQHHHKRLFRKIFSRLFLVGILPALVIVVAGGTFLFFSYEKSLLEFEEALLAQKRAEVERYVRSTLETFEIIVPFEEKAPIADEGQIFLLEGLLEDQQNLREVSFVQTLPSRHESGPPIGGETARRVRDDPNASPRESVNTDAFNAARQGRSYVGNIVWEDNVPVVQLAAPVRNRRGDVIAVLMGELRLTGLREIFSSALFGEEGSVFLLDEKGDVIVHSRDSLLLKQNLSDLAALSSERRGESILDGVGGSKVLVTTAMLASPRWTFIAEWPLRDAFAPLLALLLQVLGVSVLLLVLVFLLATLQAKEIVRPIRTIQEAARDIGKGHFQREAAVQTNDELEELGEELNKMAGELAKLQEVRASEIRARALATAVAKEEELSQAKDVLISTASHQFRTPVSVLNWNIDLLKKMSLPGQAQMLLEGVAEHAANLAAIAGDLLNATAFGAGYAVEASEEPVAVQRVMNEALQRYHQLAQTRGLEVMTKIPEKDILLSGASFGALRIMLENLVANALIYTASGGSVEVAIEEKNNETISFTFRDTGIGIPEKEQRHLFSAFFRASNAIAMKNVGTGLGLFIARNIALGHGGSIDINSEEGKGTTVTVVLPKKRNQEIEAEK